VTRARLRVLGCACSALRDACSALTVPRSSSHASHASHASHPPTPPTLPTAPFPWHASHGVRGCLGSSYETPVSVSTFNHEQRHVKPFTSTIEQPSTFTHPTVELHSQASNQCTQQQLCCSSGSVMDRRWMHAHGSTCLCGPNGEGQVRLGVLHQEYELAVRRPHLLGVGDLVSPANLQHLPIKAKPSAPSP
jgi:hypothetical protein